MNKNEQPYISVIVPVYNVGKFIDKCMSTLVNQCFDYPYEIVAVDDGTPDNSGQILDNYAKKYPFVNVIHQENRGLSGARKTGLDNSKGKYIAFVDGDDFVSKNYIRYLYEACVNNNADISSCYYYWHFVSSGAYLPYVFRTNGVVNKEEGVKTLLQDKKIQSFFWGKLIKKDLYNKANIDFPKMYFEDLPNLYKIFLQTNKVAIVNKCLYYYNIHEGSILGSMNINKVIDYVRAVEMVRCGLETMGLYNTYKKEYKALTIKTYRCNWWNISKLRLKPMNYKFYKFNMKNITNITKFCSSQYYSHEYFELYVENYLKQYYSIINKEDLEENYSAR